MIEKQIKTILGYGNIGELPDEPHNVVVITQYGGSQPDRALGKKKATVKYPTVQILVRNTSYFNGVAKIQEIEDKLVGYKDDKILQIIQIGDRIGLGRDSDGNQVFTVNFEIMLPTKKEEETE